MPTPKEQLQEVMKEIEVGVENRQQKTREIKRKKDRRREIVHRLDRLRERAKELRNKIKLQPNFNGHPTNVSKNVREIIVKANRAGLYVTSTTDGSSHAPTSYHYPNNNASRLGEAVDLGGTYENMVAFQRKLAANPGSYNEVFGPDNYACVKNGVRISIAEGTSLEQGHDNHIHVAPR